MSAAVFNQGAPRPFPSTRHAAKSEGMVYCYQQQTTPPDHMWLHGVRRVRSATSCVRSDRKMTLMLAATLPSCCAHALADTGSSAQRGGTQRKNSEVQRLAGLWWPTAQHACGAALGALPAGRRGRLGLPAKATTTQRREVGPRAPRGELSGLKRFGHTAVHLETYRHSSQPYSAM